MLYFNLLFCNFPPIAVVGAISHSLYTVAYITKTITKVSKRARYTENRGEVGRLPWCQSLFQVQA